MRLAAASNDLETGSMLWLERECPTVAPKHQGGGFESLISSDAEVMSQQKSWNISPGSLGP